MRHDFPNRVDAFPLNMTAAEKNAVDTSDKCDIVDLMFAVRELQKYVLTLAGVISPVTTETTDTAVTVDLSSVNSQITALSTQIAGMPTYRSGSGEPAASLGNNGDTYWDTLNKFEWRKAGGTWRQQP